MVKENNYNKKTKIEEYYNDNRFTTILINTKIYKELYNSKEALVAFFTSVIFISLLVLAILNSKIFENIEPKIFDLIGIVIGGLFGMLGFVIGGLALIVGSIGSKMVKLINNVEKFDQILKIIFRFYFVGAVTGFTIVLLFFSYIILLFPQEFNMYIFIIISLIISYCVFFSMIACVMLMGSCIRLFILKYKFDDIIGID